MEIIIVFETINQMGVVTPNLQINMHFADFI